MEKNILLSQENTENIKEALKVVSDLVGITYGPKGNNVLIDRGPFPLHVTKDGATVAAAIEVNDSRKSIINTIISNAQRVARTTGDGTTTTTVLTEKFYNELCKLVLENKSNIQAISIIEKTLPIILNYIQENSIEIKSGEDMYNIINISCNGDEVITNLIMDCYNVKKEDKSVDLNVLTAREIQLKQSYTTDEYIEKVDGIRFPGGYISQLFANNDKKTVCEYENPFVLINKDKLNSMKEVLIYFKHAVDNEKPLIIFTPEIDNDVLQVLVANRIKGYKICVAKTPTDVGVLEDLAFVTGATILEKGTEACISMMNLNFLGSNVKTISIEFDMTTLESTVKKEKIVDRIRDIDEQINKMDPSKTIAIRDLKQRRDKLSNGLSTIYLAANSEIEKFERKDRMEDAIGSIKSAISNGYVGGSCLSMLNSLYAIKNSDIEYKESIFNFYYNVFKETYRVICNNAQVPEALFEENLNRFSFNNITGKETDNFNLETYEYINMIENGLIDPTNVILEALKISFSTAKSLYSAKGSILIDKK